ncbi:beta/alpha barrel domain-containing protein [Helicobacter labacensis]|uniref:indole-3-glycerol phosphate synthase n=1 Tax=Helicobacter labacensis TaxID=2316079 RepID=UPI000EB0EFC6|nr:indole-3-glycerol phosphate synthase [Helicobacter labacensis]
MPLDLDTLKRYLENKQALTPLEVLGRTLAYNPYVPRLKAQDLRRAQDHPQQIVRLNAGLELEVLLERLECVANALLLDFTPLYTPTPPLESLDLLGYVRRLSSKPLIHQDYFLTPYQLLESLVHGSDGVLLNAQLLGAQLKDMCAYASRLGLLDIIEVRCKADLKASVLARASALYLSQDFATLLELTPQRFLILKNFDAHDLEHYGVDALVYP